MSNMKYISIIENEFNIISIKDTHEESWEINKKCIKDFEAAGGCDCMDSLENSNCPATTSQEYKDMVPDECHMWFSAVGKYCSLRKGKKFFR